MKDFIDTVLERARRDPEFLRELLAELKRDEVLEELAAQVRELKLDNEWLENYYNQGGTPRHPRRPPTYKRDEALDELAAQAQELGMGYDTEDGEQHPDH